MTCTKNHDVPKPCLNKKSNIHALDSKIFGYEPDINLKQTVKLWLRYKHHIKPIRWDEL